MASISAIAARRIKVIKELVSLPGAVVNPEIAETDHAGQLDMRTTGVNLTAHGVLLANTEMLELFDRVLATLVATTQETQRRVEKLEIALAEVQASKRKGK